VSMTRGWRGVKRTLYEGLDKIGEMWYLLNYQRLKDRRGKKEAVVYEYEREREVLNMQFQRPEQQQPFHQFISEPADPCCRVSCHVDVRPPYMEPIEPPWKWCYAHRTMDTCGL